MSQQAGFGTELELSIGHGTSRGVDKVPSEVRGSPLSLVWVNGQLLEVDEAPEFGAEVIGEPYDS